MERFDAYVGSIEATLQQAPVVLQSVGMNLPVNISNRVVDHLMLELVEPVIRPKGIGIQRGASLNMLANRSLNLGLFASLHNLGANLSSTLKDADDGSFILDASGGNLASPNMLVHVSGFAADEGFVCFDNATLTAQLDKGVGLHGATNAMHHEPSGLLGHANCSGDLAGANPVLAVAQHPERAHPLIQAERRILEYRPDLEGELLLASRAKPDAPRLDERVFLGAATRARDNAIRPAKVYRVLKAAVWIAEVNNRFLKCLGRFHAIIMRLLSLCVKYVITRN